MACRETDYPYELQVLSGKDDIKEADLLANVSMSSLVPDTQQGTRTRAVFRATPNELALQDAPECDPMHLNATSAIHPAGNRKMLLHAW